MNNAPHHSAGFVVGAAAAVAVTLVAVAGGIVSFMRAEDLEARLGVSLQERDALRKDADTQRGHVEAMAARLGVVPGDDAALRAKVMGDAAARGIVASYPARIDELEASVQRLELQLAASRDGAAGVRRQLEQSAAVGAAKAATLKEALDGKNAELLGLSQRHRAALADLQARIDALGGELEAARSKLLQARNEYEAALGEKDRRIAQLEKAFRTLKGVAGGAGDSAEPLALAFTLAGRVTAIDQGRLLATINYGRNAGARVGLALRIHQPDPSGKQGPLIAMGEISELDDTTCKATLKLAENIVPVVVGCLAYAPALAAGGQAIGVVGKLDLDGDGADDFDEFQRIVAKNGGSVAFRLDPKGVRTGRLEPTLRCLVMDEALTVGGLKDPRRAYQEKVAAAVTEARNLGVGVTSSRKFLEELGHQTGRPVGRPAGREVRRATLAP